MVSTAEMDRELLIIFIRQLLVPALAAAPLTEVAVNALKQELALYLREVQGASVPTIARHLEVSTRWVSLITNGEKPRESKYRWFSDIMMVMTTHHPKVLLPAQVRTELRRLGRELGPQSTAAQLELYARLDLLEKVGRGYRAKHFVGGVGAEQREEHLEKLSRRFERLWAVARSFARAEPGASVGEVRGVMDQQCLVEYTAELQELVAATSRKYTERTRARIEAGEAQLVSFSTIVAVGQVPGQEVPPGEEHEES